MSKLVSIVDKDKVFLYVFNHKYDSSVERHMLADQKQCLVFVVLYEFT